MEKRVRNGLYKVLFSTFTNSPSSYLFSFINTYVSPAFSSFFSLSADSFLFSSNCQHNLLLRLPSLPVRFFLINNSHNPMPSVTRQRAAPEAAGEGIKEAWGAPRGRERLEAPIRKVNPSKKIWSVSEAARTLSLLLRTLFNTTLSYSFVWKELIMELLFFVWRDNYVVSISSYIYGTE